MKDYEAFEGHHLDHWKEQGYIQADTEPSGKVKEGEPMKSRSIRVIEYLLENMNTREKRVHFSYESALSEYDKLSSSGAAHGLWRLVALLNEQIL